MVATLRLQAVRSPVPLLCAWPLTNLLPRATESCVQAMAASCWPSDSEPEIVQALRAAVLSVRASVTATTAHRVPKPQSAQWFVPLGCLAQLVGQPIRQLQCRPFGLRSHWGAVVRTSGAMLLVRRRLSRPVGRRASAARCSRRRPSTGLLHWVTPTLMRYGRRQFNGCSPAQTQLQHKTAA